MFASKPFKRKEKLGGQLDGNSFDHKRVQALFDQDKSRSDKSIGVYQTVRLLKNAQLCSS